jgi:hypothetical protein
MATRKELNGRQVFPHASGWSDFTGRIADNCVFPAQSDSFCERYGASEENKKGEI